MRVLHLVKTSSGAPWALRQMRELTRLGVEVHVALPDRGRLAPAYEAAGVTVHVVETALPTRRPWTWYAQATALRVLVDRVEPDIIHSHFVTTTIAARLALRSSVSIPRVFQVPGPLHLEHALFRRAEIATATRADYWIASCRWTRDCYLRERIQPDRVFLSYYGIDTDYFRRQPGTLRDELGIRPGTPLIGMVAYCYPPKRYLGQTRGLKGHEDLIDATAILAKTLDGIHCVIIGGPAPGAERYYESVRRYAERRAPRRVSFLGFRPDVRSLYVDMNVAVHPSHSDNGGSTPESLLLGVPTVATNVGGFVDIVRPGRTGWLAPPRNPEGLAEQIALALADKTAAREYARVGREHVKSLLDVRQNAREVVEAYTSVLTRSSSRSVFSPASLT